jgi:hypothetical protein
MRKSTPRYGPNLDSIRYHGKLDKRRILSAETTLAGEMVGSVQDDRYGVIGTYPLAILKAVFEKDGLN